MKSFMDIVKSKPKSTWINKKILTWGLMSAVLGGVLVVSALQKDVDFAIDKERVMIATIDQGPMAVKVSGNGLLVPDDFKWLASQVVGRVEQVNVKAGAKVTKGEAIVLLSNPELKQLADETRWSYEAQLAQLNALQVSLEAEKLNQEARVTRAEFAYQGAQLQFKAEKTLLEQASGVVSKVEHQKTQLNMEQLLRSWQIEQAIAAKNIENASAQLIAKKAEVNRLHNMLLRAEHQVKNLTIYASMDGIVQESSLEVGEQVNIGTNVAKIADPNSLMAEVQIPELLSGEVALNQLATIDTRSGTIEGIVTRIDPGVVNGNVQVDIKLTGELTSNARPELSVVGEIIIADITNTLHASRPAFVKHNSMNTLFKVNDSGYAERVAVKVGKTSTNQIQILSGLAPGERIIISDTSDWTDFKTILIN